MSLQNILETSPIAQWIITHTVDDSAPETAGHPSQKVIAFESDRESQPFSEASNIVSDLFLHAEDANHIHISVRSTRGSAEVLFDKKPVAEIALAPGLGGTVSRRLLFLAGYLDYPPKPAPHNIRVRVKGRLQVWECRKRADSVELRRLS